MNQEGSSKSKGNKKNSAYINAGTMRYLAERQKNLLLTKRKFVKASSNNRGTKELMSNTTTSEEKLQEQPHPEVEMHTRTIEEHVGIHARIVEEQVQQDSMPTSNEVCEEQGPFTKKRQRGRTQMKSVHARTERKLVVLNEKDQPVGPTDDVVAEFSSFLGTLARNPTFCPLDITDWRFMDTKDDLWEYTKTKYDIPDAAKKWALEGISSAWRRYKCRLKKAHFDASASDAALLENRPQDVSELVFKELLKHWRSEKVQKMSDTNTANRKKLKNPHTVGKTSFAIVRNGLENEEGRSGSVTLKEIFTKTRERKPGRSYKTSNEDTATKIAEMEKIQSQQSEDDNEPVNAFTSVMGLEHPGRLRLYGRGVTKTSLQGKVGHFELSSRATNDQVLDMMKKMEEKFAEEKAAMRQEILAEVLTELRNSRGELDLDKIAAQQTTIQPIHRPSVGSTNRGESNEYEMLEGSDEELDLI